MTKSGTDTVRTVENRQIEQIENEEKSEDCMESNMDRKGGWKCECFATLPIWGCEASVSGLPPYGPVVHLGPSRPLGMKTSGPPPYVMTERTHSRLNSPCGSAC